MKLIGLLCFYDEPVEDLMACLASLRDAGVDEIAAVDGAYALYPGGQAASHPNQHAAIVLTCRELGLGCTLHVPAQTWAGNEVQKRTFHFKQALAISEPGDWFWVMDADQIVKNVPGDLKAQLAATEHDVAEVEFLDTVAARVKQADWPERFTVRDLFRAQPISVVTNHITYMTDDGRLLWGYDGGEKPLEPALDLTDTVLVEHRPDHRSQDRQLAKLAYYAQRDNERVERGTCSRCDEPSVRLVATKWRMTRLGPVGDWAEACETHAARLERIGRRQLLQMGVDPDRITIENRNGQAPAGMTA